MKKLRLANVAGLLVVVGSLAFAALFIGFFIVFPRIEFSGPGPTRGMSAGIAFVFFYTIFVALSVTISVLAFLFRKHVSKRWIRYLGFLPILMTIGTPIGFVFSLALKPSIDAQRHRLSVELRSSMKLEKCSYEFFRSYGSVSGPLDRPERIGEAYVYRLSTTIYKFRPGGRKLAVHTSWGTSEFTFDAIPEMPHPIPSFTDWTGPNSVEPKQIGGPDLRIRYRVTKD